MKKFLQIMIFILCALVIAGYFWSHKSELRLLGHITLRSVLALFILNAAANGLQSFKLLLVFRSLGLRSVSIYEWFKIFIVSRFINLHVTQGANLFRSVKLKKSFDFSYTDSISSTYFFTWFEYLIILIAAFLLILVVPAQKGPQFRFVLLTCAVLVVCLFLLPFTFRTFLAVMGKLPGQRLMWIRDKLRLMLQNFNAQIQDIALTFKYTCFTLIAICLYTLMCHIGFLALNSDATLTRSLLFAMMFMLSRSFNILPGNLGVSEIICGYFAGLIGSTLGAGALVATLIRIVNYLFLAALTLIYNKSLNLNPLVHPE